MQFRTDFALMSATLASLLGIACGPAIGDDDDGPAADGSESADDSGPETGETGGGSGSAEDDGTGSPLSCPAPLANMACDAEQPLMLGELEVEGWMQCGNGVAHRVSADACVLPPGDFCAAGEGDGGSGGVNGTCVEDSECTDADHGRCLPDPWGGGCGCTYTCETDADCGGDQACMCRGNWSVCLPADCKTDDDCGEGSMCTVEVTDNSCGTSAGRLTCTTPADSCGSGSDCSYLNACIKLEDDACGFRCEPSEEACADGGRPFIVDDVPRVAELSALAGWCRATGSLEASVDGLPKGLRDRVALHWTHGGLAEHASVASFARFTLQLLALGAPSELVSQAQAATADEIDHARRCFSIASAYGGVAVGPGPLSMDAALDGGQDLVTIAESVIREGCIGETLAAAEVAEAGEWAEHPEIKTALAAIAADELRHAALAWRFLDWAVSRADDRERLQIFAFLEAMIETSLDRMDTAAGEGGDSDETDLDGNLARRHGVLSRRARKAVHATALRSIVVPCAQGLLRRYRDECVESQRHAAV